VLSYSIQQVLLVITNGRQEVHARTLTSVCKSGMLWCSFAGTRWVAKGSLAVNF